MNTRRTIPRKNRVVAAGIAAVVLAAVATTLVLGPGTGRDTHRGAVPHPTSAPPPRPRPSGGGPVDVTSLRWRDFHGIALPYTPQAGPRRRDGDLASGYADTRTGAVVAALNIAVRANAQWGPGVFVPTIRRQVVGVDRPALLNGCRSDYQHMAGRAGVSGGDPIGRGYAVEAGYRFVSYSPQAATVDVLTTGPGSDGGTARAATRIQTVWRSGDWRVVAPSGGDWGNTAAAVTGNGTNFTYFHGGR